MRAVPHLEALCPSLDDDFGLVLEVDAGRPPLTMRPASGANVWPDGGGEPWARLCDVEPTRSNPLGAGLRHFLVTFRDALVFIGNGAGATAEERPIIVLSGRDVHGREWITGLLRASGYKVIVIHPYMGALLFCGAWTDYVPRAEPIKRAVKSRPRSRSTRVRSRMPGPSASGALRSKQARRAPRGPGPASPCALRAHPDRSSSSVPARGRGSRASWSGPDRARVRRTATLR